MDELTLKKRWLQLFMIMFGYSLIITVLDAPRNLQQLQAPMALYILGFFLLASFLSCSALYYCAYKKPGTRLLTLYLIVNGISLVVTPIFTFTHQGLSWLLVARFIDFGLVAWWLYLSVKLRSLNKKIQRNNLVAAGNAARE